MKSINFSVPGLFDKILNKTKTLTIRALYIPNFVEGERVLLKEIVKENGKKVVKRTVITKITYMRFIRLKEITDALAVPEGFRNAEESKEWIRKTYNTKSDERWLVVICWRDLEGPFKPIEAYMGINQPVNIH
jgi:hypothetical protein